MEKRFENKPKTGIDRFCYGVCFWCSSIYYASIALSLKLMVHGQLAFVGALYQLILMYLIVKTHVCKQVLNRMHLCFALTR